LPRESDIQAAVKQVGKEGSKRVTEEVLKQWKNKAGVREKVQDVLARKTAPTSDGKGLRWSGESQARL
jgi:hypothetical protein